MGSKSRRVFSIDCRGTSCGILYIYLHEDRQFTNLEQLMLDNFVNQAAMAITIRSVSPESGEI